jgi:hypothetical protein
MSRVMKQLRRTQMTLEVFEDGIHPKKACKSTHETHPGESDTQHLLDRLLDPDPLITRTKASKRVYCSEECRLPVHARLTHKPSTIQLMEQTHLL